MEGWYHASMPIDCANPPALVQPADPANDALRVYACEALPAWEARDADLALAAVDRALAFDPDLAPAVLLRGLALIRTRRVEEGVTVLRTVEHDPDVGPAASMAISRNDGRWTRGGVDLLAGLYFPWGVQVGMGFPVEERVRFGFDLGTTAGYLTAGPMGVSGTWSWDAGAGLGLAWGDPPSVAGRAYAAVENRRRAHSGVRLGVSLDFWSDLPGVVMIPGLQVLLVGNVQ